MCLFVIVYYFTNTPQRYKHFSDFQHFLQKKISRSFLIGIIILILIYLIKPLFTFLGIDENDECNT